MESNLQKPITSIYPESTPNICAVCHQPILSEYYFCPNCGTKIKESPLSTTIQTQTWIYVLSIILPMIGFILISKWPAVKYLKSNDPKAKQIGQVASVLLLVSTIIVIWLAYIGTQKMIQSSLDSINADFGSF